MADLKIYYLSKFINFSRLLFGLCLCSHRFFFHSLKKKKEETIRFARTIRTHLNKSSKIPIIKQNGWFIRCMHRILVCVCKAIFQHSTDMVVKRSQPSSSTNFSAKSTQQNQTNKFISQTNNEWSSTFTQYNLSLGLFRFRPVNGQPPNQMCIVRSYEFRAFLGAALSVLFQAKNYGFHPFWCWHIQFGSVQLDP